MNDKTKEMLEDCESAKTCSNVDFTSWEREFIDRARIHLDRFGKLTPRMYDKLCEVWEKI